ncbi:Uncharacterized protein Rs2_36994 [Raphanus sativus]|nr:Uncharacterized protein Rs2_36994 [Raphanus sativus]
MLLFGRSSVCIQEHADKESGITPVTLFKLLRFVQLVRDTWTKPEILFLERSRDDQETQEERGIVKPEIEPVMLLFEYLEKKFSGRIPIKPDEESSRLVKLKGRRRGEVEFKTKNVLREIKNRESIIREVKASKETFPERPLPERLVSETLSARQVTPEN